MQPNYYQLSRPARIRRLRASVKEALGHYNIQVDSFALIPSAHPVFRVETRPTPRSPARRYVLKLASGIYEEFDRPDGAAPAFYPPATDTRLQMLWLEALSRDTDLPLQTPVRNTAGELFTAVAIRPIAR